MRCDGRAFWLGGPDLIWERLPYSCGTAPALHRTFPDTSQYSVVLASIGRLLHCAGVRIVSLFPYAPFVDDRWRSEALLECGNLVILRSMTKDQVAQPLPVLTDRQTHPDCVRIACRLPEECERLLEAFARVACG